MRRSWRGPSPPRYQEGSPSGPFRECWQRSIVKLDELLAVCLVLDILLIDLLTPDRGLFEVAILTGLRRGEITGLRWSDVDLAQRKIVVRRN